MIQPFKGLLYNKNRIDDIARCVCPPYDVIPDPRTYYSRSSFNAIRLELPLPSAGLNPYESARHTLDDWISDGVLAFDERDSIYVYEQEFKYDGVNLIRRGLIPLVRLDRERILTHEQTRQKAREDRENLIRTLTTFTSLVFALYEDQTRDVARIVDNTGRELIYDFVDDNAIRNKLYRMADKAEVDRLVSAMNEKNLYIADGHHRLSVGYKLGLPYLAIYLTDMHEPGIVVQPYHRLVKFCRVRSVEEMIRAVEPYFDVKNVNLEGEQNLKEQIRANSSSPVLSFLLYNRNGKKAFRLLTQKRQIDFDPEGNPILNKLKVNVIHSGVLKHLMGIEEEEITFLNDPGEAVGTVNQGEQDLAVLVPATDVEEVKSVAANGLFMPPKSTYFYPKVLTGLVFHKYA
jgi:uncharacterized protein (DUF1015 family)